MLKKPLFLFRGSFEILSIYIKNNQHLYFLKIKKNTISMSDCVNKMFLFVTVVTDLNVRSSTCHAEIFIVYNYSTKNLLLS
jgi:hypothetical protein